MADTRYEAGELHLALGTVAEVYRVEARWLGEVHHAGLLGRCLAVAAEVYVPVSRLDLVAHIVRLHVGLGLDLQAIAVVLERHSDGEL